MLKTQRCDGGWLNYTEIASYMAEEACYSHCRWSRSIQRDWRGLLLYGHRSCYERVGRLGHMTIPDQSWPCILVSWNGVRSIWRQVGAALCQGHRARRLLRAASKHMLPMQHVACWNKCGSSNSFLAIFLWLPRAYNQVIYKWYPFHQYKLQYLKSVLNEVKMTYDLDCRTEK